MATLDRNRYDAMKRQAQNASFRRTEADRNVKSARDELNRLNINNDGLSAIDVCRIQKQFESANEDVQKELDELREEIGIRLGQQSAETKRALDDIRGLVRKNRDDIETIAKRVSSLEKKVTEGLQDIAAQIENRRKQSIYYYDRYAELIEQIKILDPEIYEALYPEQLYPGMFTLQTGIVDVMGNIEKKNYEAAIGLAQSRIPEAASMLGKLQFFHNQFIDVKEECDKASEDLKKQFVYLQHPPAQIIVFENDEFEDDRGIGYWTKELFDSISHEIDACYQRMDQLLVDHDADGLMTIIDEIAELQEKLKLCEIIANNEARLHYECTYTAYEISETLEKNGAWSRIDGPWPTDESDLRGPVSVTLTGNGFNAVITCFPLRKDNSEEKGSVGIGIEVFDDRFEKDDISRCQPIHSGIVAVLRNSGFKAEDLVSENLSSETKSSFLTGTLEKENQYRKVWLEKQMDKLNLVN